MRLRTVRPLLLHASVIVALCLPAAASLGATINRGPWLLWPTIHGVTVCWTTDVDAPGIVRVLPESQSTLPPAKQRYRMVRDATSASMHQVKVTGLRPYTRYRYDIECDGASATGSFTTAATRLQPFRFVAYGDNRSNLVAHAAVIAQVLKFHPDFVLQSGDLVANGEIESQWDDLFKTAEPMFRDVPIFTVPGNHERNASWYFRYFPYPHDYSFDYGDCHIVALDTNRPASEIPAQDEWLKKDLAAHQSARWRILFCHHTFYTATNSPGRRQESAERIARMGPILKAGHVQLVISGHDHNYQRHMADGITFIVSGGGGAPLYDLGDPTPYLKKAAKVHHECEFSVSDQAIEGRAVADDGTVIDTFRIVPES